MFKVRLERETARVFKACPLQRAVRDDRWSEAIAVGSLAFVDKVKNDLGLKAIHRDVLQADGTYALRESAEAYALKFADETEALSSENTILWDESVVDARI